MTHARREPDRRLAVAPMMDRTDRHDRWFLRLITRHTLLYTEMLTTGAVLNGDRDRLLGFDPRERPLALQLGGADPAALAACARIAEGYGYDEINLNVGCPSDRVRSACFGAALMAEPGVVADCVAAMRAAVDLPVTVKTRIGIDDRDSFEALLDFVDTVAAAGCRSFIVHARKAWLSGLSPRENRTVPPLDHDRVHRLKRARPHLEIVLNGGIADLDAVEAHLAAGADGVMLGRAAYETPWVLAEADRRIFAATTAAPTRAEVVDGLIAYGERLCARDLPVRLLTRHILGLCTGLPGARAWRRHLSEVARQPGAGPEVIADAYAQVRDAIARQEAACAEAAAQ